ADKFPADDFAFALGIGDAAQFREKAFRSVHVFKFDTKVLSENLLDGFGFAGAKHAVVDKNAGELVANGLVNQGGGHTGIHPAAQAEYDVTGADLRPDFFDRLLDVVAHGPVFATAANFVDEIGKELLAARRVRHLGMKLHAKDFLPAVLDGGELGIFRDRDAF